MQKSTRKSRAKIAEFQQEIPTIAIPHDADGFKCPCCENIIPIKVNGPKRAQRASQKQPEKKSYSSTAVGLAFLLIIIALLSSFFNKVFENDKKAQKARQEYYGGR